MTDPKPTPQALLDLDRVVHDRLPKATARYAFAWQTPVAPLLIAGAGLLGAAGLLHSGPYSAAGRLLLVYTCPAWAAALLVTSRRWAPPAGEVDVSPLGAGGRFRTSAFLTVTLAAFAALGAARGDWHVASAGAVALALALPARDLGRSKALGFLLAIATLTPPSTDNPWRVRVTGALLLALALVTWLSRESAAQDLADTRAATRELIAPRDAPPSP